MRRDVRKQLLTRFVGVVQPAKLRPWRHAGADDWNMQTDTYQDVQGILWLVFVLFDGSKNREDETGEDQEEAGKDERNFLISGGSQLNWWKQDVLRKVFFFLEEK